MLQKGTGQMQKGDMLHCRRDRSDVAEGTGQMLMHCRRDRSDVAEGTGQMLRRRVRRVPMFGLSLVFKKGCIAEGTGQTCCRRGQVRCRRATCCIAEGTGRMWRENRCGDKSDVCSRSRISLKAFKHRGVAEGTGWMWRRRVRRASTFDLSLSSLGQFYATVDIPG
jgi:hypothetical protein